MDVHAENIHSAAEEILAQSQDAKVRRNAKTAQRFARLASTMDGGGASQAMEQARIHLNNAAIPHSGRIEQEGGYASPKVLDAAFVSPTEHHDNWVNETNEGLKNGS